MRPAFERLKKGIACPGVDVLYRPRAISAVVDRRLLARAEDAGRRRGLTDTEKAVPLDDPQIEFGELRFVHLFMCGGGGRSTTIWTDARSWRFRCRVMAAISLVTYVPFVVCVAIFA